MRIQGPESKEMEQSLLDESHKLHNGLEMRVQGQKVANPGYILHGTIFEGKSMGSNQKNKAKKESS